jgi:hypothetical protein
MMYNAVVLQRLESSCGVCLPPYIPLQAKLVNPVVAIFIELSLPNSLPPQDKQGCCIWPHKL